MKARPRALIACILLRWVCPAEADVHYVSEASPSPGWPYATPDTAARSIASAMEAASCGDTVFVLPGYYQDIRHPEGTQLKPGVNLIGSGPAHTVIFGSPILLGELFPDPEVPPCERPTTISGLRFVDSGLGVWQGQPPLSLTVSQCHFDGSTVRINGSPTGSITFKRCLFDRIRDAHTSYAISATYVGGLNVLDSVFDLSDSLGRTGGLVFFDANSVLISRCAFKRCSVGVECHISQHSPAEVENCLFLDNALALDTGYGPVLVSRCTFSRNRWAATSATPDYRQQFRDCIVWGNEEGNILEVRKGYPDDVYAPEITFSDVQGGYPGRGNIDADPMFFLPSEDGPDFHLCAASPCIDAGDPFSDYSNEPEPNGGRVNMGAYGNTWEATTSELVDTDGDNMRDDWEIEHFGNLDRNGFGDADGDGLNDREEYRHLSDPSNPDTDSDGLLDGEEFSLRTDPLIPDTDNDGTPDAKEVAEGTNPLDWKDAFTILNFSIEGGYLYVTFPTLPGYEYSLESSNWPNGPFGLTVDPYRGRSGVLTHTHVLRLGPYNRFFRIRAREYPGGEGSR